jgi:hypothetical protein
MLEQLDKDFPDLGEILKFQKSMGDLAVTELQRIFYKSYTLLELQNINHAWVAEQRERPVINQDRGVALLQHFQREGK